MSGTRTEAISQPRSERGRARPRSPVVLSAVTAAQGAGLASLAGADGSPAWRTARVLAVIAVTGLGVWFTCLPGRGARGGTALVLGMLGTVVGAGVAGAHLGAGLGAVAVAAVIVLVTGLILLI